MKKTPILPRHWLRPPSLTLALAHRFRASRYTIAQRTNSNKQYIFPCLALQIKPTHNLHTISVSLTPLLPPHRAPLSPAGHVRAQSFKPWIGGNNRNKRLDKRDPLFGRRLSFPLREGVGAGGRTRIVSVRVVCE
jgi:hypothetical protein